MLHTVDFGTIGSTKKKATLLHALLFQGPNLFKLTRKSLEGDIASTFSATRTINFRDGYVSRYATQSSTAKKTESKNPKKKTRQY